MKGASLQSGAIKRDLFVRAPRRWPSMHGILRKLLKLIYRIADVGRQWKVVVEEWTLAKDALQRVFGLSKWFLKRAADGSILLLICKVTDDFLFGGSLKEMQKFMELLQKLFYSWRCSSEANLLLLRL